MAGCDLCKKTCRVDDIKALRPCFQTHGIVDLCPACMRWADDRLSQLQSAVVPQLRALIREQAGKTPARPFWLRLKMFGRKDST